MWSRVGSSVPSHARRTKGSSSAGNALKLFRLATSWFIVLPRSRGTAEVLIAAFDGGAVVLDPSRGVVHRRYGTGPVSEEYIEWRRDFSEHVTAPAFEVSPNRDVVTEELVDGDYLLDVDVDTRVSALRQLLHQYAELTRSEGRVEDRPIENELEDVLSRARLPQDFQEMYGTCDVGWLAPPVVWVPSAYEATAKNLLVRRDGVPIPIDLGDLCLEPCFSYPVGVITSAGPGVVGRYLEGHFDDALQDLLDGAGRTWRVELTARVGLLLVRLTYGALCDSRGVNGVDMVAFERSVERRWTDIKPSLKALSDG